MISQPSAESSPDGPRLSTPLSESCKALAEALDDSDEEKIEEFKFQHIQFHPESMSDIEIVYEDCVFHCHRVILAQKSKVWENLFTQGFPERRIIYSMKQMSREIEIFSDEFHYFLLSFYYPFESSKGFLLSSPMEFDPQASSISLMHLFHYFKVPDMENRFVDTIRADINLPLNNMIGYCYLLLATVSYEIPQGQKILIEAIARVHPKTKEGNKQFLEILKTYGRGIPPSLIHELHYERMNYVMASNE